LECAFSCARGVKLGTGAIVPLQEEAQRAGERLGFYSLRLATGRRVEGKGRGTAPAM